jgi:hypothetical protein
LLSIDAWNQIGLTTIFQTYGGHTYARAYAEPGYRRTAKQDAIRLINVQITTAWTALSAANRRTWKAPAARRNEAPQNTFYRVNFNRLRSARPIANTYPPPP